MRRITKYRFQFIILLYGILAVLLLVWIQSNEIASIPASIFSGLLFFFLVLFTFVLSRIHLFYHSKSAISAIHLGIISLFTFIGVWSSYGLSRSIFEGDTNFQLFLANGFLFTFLVFFMLLLLSASQFWIDKHIQEQERTLQQLLKKERDLARAELSNIQEQFRPHFIFNSLNSISALVVLDPEKAREMIYHLSDFLRASVVRDDERFHSLKEELHFLNLYLSIEKVRFEDRLTVELPEIQNSDTTKIPVLILQPILENAIKFGIYGTTGVVTIKIELEENKEFIRIKISNPFDSESLEASKGKGYGVESIRKKMFILYHRNDLVEITQKENLFSFQLTIPQL